MYKMTTHVDRLEVSSLSDPDFPPHTALAASFLSSPMEETEDAGAAEETRSTARFTDRLMHSESSEPPELVNFPSTPLHDEAQITEPSAQAPAVPPAETRMFPPATAPETEVLLAGLATDARHALETVYGAFLAADDPYLESADLSALAERLDCNETRLRREIESLSRVGLLRLVRGAKDGEVALAESTFAGLETFCRAVRGAGHPAFLEDVGRCIAEGRATDGPSLMAAFRNVPGLLLTHAVETLARDGWIECSEQFGGACGCQLGRISPDLKAWAGIASVAEPATFWAA